MGMIKEVDMGAMIYVSGEGAVDGEFTEAKVSALKEIKDGWGYPAFCFSENGSGFEIAETPMEGSDPYTDGVLTPLNSLIEYAKSQGLVVNAEFTITSDWGDYDNIEVIIKDNELTTANSEVVNATTEELEAELAKRNDCRYPFKEAADIIASRDENNYVEGYVQIHISDMIDNDYDGFLDLISEKLVDSDLLMDINYEVVAQAKKMFPDELILKVTGDASSIVEDEEE